MNWEIFTNSKIVENIGWTLLHSFWQIALVAFVLLLLLRVLRSSSANVRYLAAVSPLPFHLFCRSSPLCSSLRKSLRQTFF